MGGQLDTGKPTQELLAGFVVSTGSELAVVAAGGMRLGADSVGCTSLS